jgi:hypothetical protein
LFHAATAAGSLALLEREAQVRDELVDVVVDHPHRRRVGAPVVGRKASNPAFASAAEVDSSRIFGCAPAVATEVQPVVVASRDPR